MEQKKGNFKPGQGNFKPGQKGAFKPGQKGKFAGGRPPRRNFEPVVKVWVPKTALGRDVMAKKYANLDEVLSSGRLIQEGEIADFLEPALGQEFINVGQAKGKFGGGKRKVSKPTQKITKEGSVMSFAMISVTGNRNGVVGVGFGKARETVPSREKAVLGAKKNLIMIRRGCGDWGCFCGGSHSIPFAVTGVSGSVSVKLMPAPKGTGLVVEAELKKMLELAGIKDVWSKTFGATKNKNNMMKAGFEALKALQKVKIMPSVAEGRGIMDGASNE
jgi:small subunit ribosomal protein S5